MKAPPTRSSTPTQEDWLQDCGFQSRQDNLNGSVAPGILSQKLGRPFAEADAAPAHVVEEFHLPGRDIFPLIEAEPITTTMTEAARKEKADEVAAELRSFRKLSTNVFCPETKRDTYPEYILFGLIILLAALWPILAMFGVMAHHR